MASRNQSERKEAKLGKISSEFQMSSTSEVDE